MRRFLLVLLAAASSAHGQSEDSLSVTLPSGKVIHFQDEGQKAQYLAARQRMASAAPAPPAAPTQPTPSTLGHTALDDKPAMNGKVNVSAPTFTADYYMFAPETWQGKPITVSIAYLTRDDAAPRQDGMVKLKAQTYGTYQGNGDQHFGGLMTVLATPTAAQRILTLCGTRMVWQGWNYKVSFIKGRFDLVGDEGSPARKYGLIVTQ